MNYQIEIEQEEDGRYIAEIVEIPGVLVYGNSQEEALSKVQALALRVLADQVEQGELQMISNLG
jgi:predicted RNase H-like HicB family nuclease